MTIPAFADDWSGKLIDATCSDQQQHEKTVSCDATAQTTVFALDVTGKIFKLDAGGNQKAATALKFRASPPDSADKSKPESREVKAKITGTEAAGTIVVESITLQ